MINSRYATSLTRTGTNEGRGYPIHSMRTGSSFDFKTGLRMGRASHNATNTSKPRRPIRPFPDGRGGHVWRDAAGKTVTV